MGSWCKPCFRATRRAQRAKRKDTINAAARTAYHADLEKSRAYCKTKRERNPERAREVQVNYRERHKDELRVRAAKWARDRYVPRPKRIKKEKVPNRSPEYLLRRKELHALWYASHPDSRVTIESNRRAKKRLVGGAFTAKEWRTLKEQFDHRCLRCGKQEPHIKLAADHVIPISKGGRNVISNIQPLCGICNSIKGTRATDYRPIQLPSNS